MVRSTCFCTSIEIAGEEFTRTHRGDRSRQSLTEPLELLAGRQ